MDSNKPEHWFEPSPSRWDVVLLALFVLFLLTPLAAWRAACAYPSNPVIRLVTQALYSSGGIALGCILFIAALYRCFARPRRP